MALRSCGQGTFVDGMRQGFGKCTYSDGSQFEGAWKSNRRNGTGVCRWDRTRRFRPLLVLTAVVLCPRPGTGQSSRTRGSGSQISRMAAVRSSGGATSSRVRTTHVAVVLSCCRGRQACVCTPWVTRTTASGGTACDTARWVAVSACELCVRRRTRVLACIPCGQGTYSTTEGVTHTGEWRNGMRHGWGRESTPDGSVVEGVVRPCRCLTTVVFAQLLTAALHVCDAVVQGRVHWRGCSVWQGRRRQRVGVCSTSSGLVVKKQ